MKQLLMTVAALCMAAALCEQLTRPSRFYPAIRLALGLRIAAVAVTAVCGAWRMLNG
ncbi:MAG: hypothetical protein Q4G06_01985 [Clostridia bacterium]|nr:hypothetical protein [Clostridia bacterium]